MKDVKIVYSLPGFALSEISRVYKGKPDACMCGCAGKYFYVGCNTTWSGKNRGYPVDVEDIDDPRVLRILHKMEKFAYKGIEAMGDDIYTLVLGNTQYSLYLVDRIS